MQHNEDYWLQWLREVTNRLRHLRTTHKWLNKMTKRDTYLEKLKFCHAKKQRIVNIVSQSVFSENFDILMVRLDGIIIFGVM